MMRYKHSGKLGDVIYALPTIKACGKGQLYLDPAREFLGDVTLVQRLIPLLKIQPYIDYAGIWRGEPYDVDLDQFRTKEVKNLADAHLQIMGLSSSWRNDRWLSAERCEWQIRVVFARSLAHRGPTGFWERCFDLFGQSATFVGSATEHCSFCKEIGEIPYLRTRDLLDLAEVIAACYLFVGNQSCPLAIAEGLKVPVVQETFEVANCVFERPDALQVRNVHDIKLIDSFVSGILRERGTGAGV